MSNKSVLGSPQISHSQNRTAFPISQDFTFSCSTGMLLPVYTKRLNIGEKITGVPKFFLRTEPLLAPSMTDIDVYVDTFFVPMRHICSMFDNWFTQVADAPSDLWNENYNNYLPLLRSENNASPFSWLTPTIFDTILYYPTSIRSFGFDLHRLTQHLGYNAQALFVNSTVPSTTEDANAFDGIVSTGGVRSGLRDVTMPSFSPYLFAAYQKIYYDIYRDTEIEGNNVKAYNFDSVFNNRATYIDPSTDFYNSGTLNDVNGRMGMFALRYRNRNKDYFTAVRRNPLFNDFGFLPNAANDLSAIKNWLAGSAVSEIASDGLSAAVNDSSNLVDLTTGSDFGRWSKRNGSPIDGDSAVSAASYGYLFGNYNGNIVDLQHTHNITGYIQQQININSLRVGFALDKLLRVQNRAGRHADNQFYALFGVKLPQGISNETYRIKSYHTMVHLGEVISTAQTQITDGETTSVTPLGEMAGRGVAVLNSDERFSFTAPCHGIFMTIFSISPRYKYINAVEKEGFAYQLMDFYRPQTDNLGQQPLFAYEVQKGYTPTERFGWQYYMMESKIKFDRVTNAFATNGFSPWAFNHPAPHYDSTSGLGVVFNKVEANALNSLFVSEYNGFYRYPKCGDALDSQRIHMSQFPSCYLRDPFKVDFSMQATLVSEMSRFGEPELGGI